MEHAYYLDTHVYDHLALRNPEYGRRLAACVQRDRCRVFGSVELLEEIAGLVKEEDELLRVLAFFWSVVGRNVLNYSCDLHDRELKKGSRLAMKEACLTNGDVKQLKQDWCDRDFLKEVTQEVRTVKLDYAATMCGLGDEANRAVIELCRRSSGEPKDLYRELHHLPVTESKAEEWYRHWCSCRVKHLPNFHDVPCTRAWVAIQVARIHRRHSIQPTRDKKSDLYDNSHYALAAFVGHLVTDDKKFRNVIDSLNWKPVPVLSIEEFCDRIDELYGSEQ